jgi:DNA-binding NtrC family response regulator
LSPLLIRPTDESKSIPARGMETVLVVEDQGQVLTLAKDILTSCGDTVLDAGDVHDAMDIAWEYERPIELLLTDVVIPDMNGKQLFEQLMTTLHPKLKVLYMSGYTDNVIVHHGILDKGINFISKPFGVQDLAAKVRKSLDR